VDVDVDVGVQQALLGRRRLSMVPHRLFRVLTPHRYRLLRERPTTRNTQRNGSRCRLPLLPTSALGGRWLTSLGGFMLAVSGSINNPIAKPVPNPAAPGAA
jgi:hypothetical protein